MADKEARAFRVYHRVKFPGGRVVGATDYMETDDAGLIGQLLRCKPHTCIEVELGAPAPRAKAVTKPEDPEPASSADDGPSAQDGEPQPEWEFKTIPAMRDWLDRTGVELPKSARGKGKHEDLCTRAWSDGRRPSPLYGLPGGPQPAPGHAGPVVTIEALEGACQALDAAGLEIPVDTKAAIEELRAAGTAHDEILGDAEPDADAEPEGEPARADGQPATDPELTEAGAAAVASGADAPAE